MNPPIDCTAAKAAFVPLLQQIQKQNLQQLHWSTSTRQNPQELKWLKDFVEQNSQPLDEPLKVRIHQEFFDCGPLSQLIFDTEITEIILNGPEKIFYEKAGNFFSHPDHFYSDVTFHNFIDRICQEAKICIDLNQPTANGNWRGLRLHLVGPPLSEPNICLTLRRHPENPWTLDQLSAAQWCQPNTKNILTKLVEQHSNLLIVGPTGCGKTSVLNALLQMIPPLQRVICIEDTKEVFLPNSMSCRLLTRQMNNDTLRSFDQSDLVRESLRMRPERLVVGEIRGAEAKDLILALSTGHRGCMSTLHAHSAKEALLRLEMLVQLGAPQWSLTTIRNMIRFALDYVIELEIKDKQRKLKSIQRLCSIEATGYVIEEVLF